LNILIEGKADVKIYENQTYTDGHGYRHTHQKYFNADEIYLNSTIPLLVCATLPRGRSIFPFQYALPLTHLPCTIEASHGAISYTITANIKSAAFPDGVLREAIFFIVGSHLDLNTIRLKDAYRANVFKDVRPIEGCCCSFTQPTESILHELYVPKRVFIPGEFIQFQMKIENKTKGVRLESGVMKFVLLVTCNGKGTTRKNETVLGQVAGPEVKPGSVQNWEVNNLWVPVIKPVGIPATGLEECGIIDAHYELQVNKLTFYNL